MENIEYKIKDIKHAIKSAETRISDSKDSLNKNVSNGNLTMSSVGRSEISGLKCFKIGLEYVLKILESE